MFVLIDSSAWTHALRPKGDATVRARVEQALNDRVAAWCEMVRLELWSGVRNDRERKALEQLDETLPRLPITDAVWEAAAIFASKARNKGITVPATDLLIFACAAAHGADIEHADRHYEMLEQLK